MASLTAVELGTDTCAFAHTMVRGGDVRLFAGDVLDPAAFPGMDAFTIAVRQTRRKMRLPRRCRAVVWGLPDGATRKDAAVKPLLAPLTNAGFRVERVVSPCNALAALARLKSSRGEGSTCWLAINRGGVALVVVRPGKLLYAHSFAWDSSIGASGSQARLLQRYSLVSYLAPEVKRAMAEARKSGTPVVAVVTCGNLPDLRSLTMPLIEELDVEVETLDSLEGLIVTPQAAAKLTESAPAIRLACAAAIARGTRPWDPSKKQSRVRVVSRALSAAAIVLALLAVAYQWYGKPRSTTPPPFVPLATGVQAKKQESAPPAKPPVVPARPAVAVPPPPVSVQSTNIPPKGGNHTPGRGATAPVPSVPAKAPESRGAVSVPAKRPESNPPAALNTPAVSADKPETRPAARVPPAMPPLLDDPVPKVTAILVSRDRRFATADGRIVGVGDVLGHRTVVALDERSVVFQEPSGVQIRIGLGGRLLGTEWTRR